MVLSLSALEGSIEALPVLRSGSAGSNGDDDALLNMDLQHVRHNKQRDKEREREEIGSLLGGSREQEGRSG